METYLTINLALVIIGFTLVFAEIFVGIDGLFDLVLSGFSLITGGAIGILATSSIVGLVASILLLVTYWLLGRKYVRSRLNVVHTPSNSDRLVGMQTKVEKVINSEKYLIKIEGEEWTAVGTLDLVEGSNVEVIEASGSILSIKAI